MDAGLKRDLEDRVRAGERLSRADGIALYGSDDLAWLGGLAHEARTRRHGDRGHIGPGGERDGDGYGDGDGDTAAATLTYGAEEPAARVDALLRLREQQDDSGAAAWQVVVPLAQGQATGAEVLKTYAVCRLLVDNIPHLRAPWTAYGEQTALLALQHGADDVDGPGEGTDLEDLLMLVRDAGLTPVERDSRYEVVREHPGPERGRRDMPQPMRL